MSYVLSECLRIFPLPHGKLGGCSNAGEVLPKNFVEIRCFHSTIKQGKMRIRCVFPGAKIHNTGTPLKNIIESPHTGMQLEKLWPLQPTLEHLLLGVYCSALHTSSALQTCTSTSLCACLGYEHQYIFVYLGLQFKWNQISSNNCHHTRCIHDRFHDGRKC